MLGSQNQIYNHLKWKMMRVVMIRTTMAVVLLTVPASTIPLKYTDSMPEQQCGYQSCPSIKHDMLNVHLICHSHDDVGWLKTVDQYYLGYGGVKQILNSVVAELQINPERRFIYVETAFFWLWWLEQSDVLRHQVRQLVKSGQLEFIGGGWSMNDEATAHYNDIIDQMTWGFRRLNDTFGQCAVPKIGWQIDPFGHSREQASLFAQMGFDGMFFGRIDYQDKIVRLNSKKMEVIWKASANLGVDGELFTGTLYNIYSPPPGFCFDSYCADRDIIDDPKLASFNVYDRVKDFLKLSIEQGNHYATNNIAMTMGNDFNYKIAESWYKNLDKLIYYVNKLQINGSKVNVFYSTPSCYLYALNKANQTWSVKTDDYFPYASEPNAYWTGYFTSRPALKGYIRETNNILQVCKQLDALAQLGPFTNYDLNVLREAQAVAQHHDAVSGTEKQHVASDYAERLAKGVAECQGAVSDAYQKLMPLHADKPPEQVFCSQLNESVCSITESKDAFVINVYNPIARPVNYHVRIPVTRSAFEIVGSDGEKLQGQLVPIPQSVYHIPGRNSTARFELVFQVDLPALGYKTFFVEAVSDLTITQQQRSSVLAVSNHQNAVLNNGFVQVTISGSTGLLQSVINFPSSIFIPVRQNFFLYHGMGPNRFRASGAYIFRPNGTHAYPITAAASVIVVNGPVVQEVHQTFNSWVSQVIRLYNNSRHVEMEWLIGPIPVADRIGKEIISYFDTELETDGKFYTDSNGREMIERVRNYRPTWHWNVTEPIAGNYYPITSKAYIKDIEDDKQVTLLTDRAVGGSSLHDGSLEIMVHRRLLHDDGYGVTEPLNEPGVDGKGLVVRGKTHLLIDKASVAARGNRDLAQRLLLQPLISFAESTLTPEQWIAKFQTEFSGLTKPLPPNVHLLTLEQWKGKSLLLRLEHFYEREDDPKNMSLPVTVNLRDLFSTFSISSASETTLGANQLRENMHRLQWNVDSNDVQSSPTANLPDVVEDGDPLTVTLQPMQIKTFIVNIDENYQ